MEIKNVHCEKQALELFRMMPDNKKSSLHNALSRNLQYTAASLYAGGWRSDAFPDLVEQFHMTSEEAERICGELLEIEQKEENKED